MKLDSRVFERDVWLDGRTRVVRPAAASGCATDKIWLGIGENVCSPYVNRYMSLHIYARKIVTCLSVASVTILRD